MSYFLRIEVKKLKDGSLHLFQIKYIKDLSEAKMQEAKGVSTPMVAGVKLSKQAGDIFEEPQIYRSIVGACSTQQSRDQKFYFQ